MTLKQTWMRSGLIRLVASALLVVGSTGPAAAEGEPPRLPQVSTSPLQVEVPAAPAGVDAVLLDRMVVDAGSPARYSSQDFVVNLDDSQGADDFCVSSGDASWTVTNVDVVGAYNDPAYSVSSVKVFFMARGSGNLPGTGLYTATVTGGNLLNAGANQGSFQLTLATPAHLAGNNCYWLSVQAVQPPGFDAGETWQWTERTAATADHAPSAYRLPGKVGHACVGWGARLATCFPGSTTNPDLTLRLSGSVSTNHLTPQLSSMSPTAALDQDVVLTLTGLNFAAGASVSWMVGAGPAQSFAAQVINGGTLTATIPAAYVGPAGTATVRVSNPAPCQGSCVSNGLTFLLENQAFVFLPLVRR